MRRFLFALVLTAVAFSLVALTGCGADTKKNNEYVGAINKAQTDFAAGVDKLRANSASSSPGQAQKVFSGLEGAIDGVVSDLRAVKPPEKVQALHTELIGHLSQFKAAVTEAGTAAASGNRQTILAAQTKFVGAVSQVATKVGATIDAINKKLSA
jgi:hypothetical protein